jgi:hypothetical protein
MCNAIAIAEGEHGGEGRFLGEVDPSDRTLGRAVKWSYDPAKDKTLVKAIGSIK